MAPMHAPWSPEQAREMAQRSLEARRKGAGWRKGFTTKTLEQVIRDKLQEKKGWKLKQLAEGIIQQASEGNAAALAFLGARLWPVEEDQGRQGQVIIQGIRLELPGSSFALPSAQESQSETSQQQIAEATQAELAGGPPLLAGSGVPPPREETSGQGGEQGPEEREETEV